MPSMLLDYDPLLLQVALFILLNYDKGIDIPITISTGSMLIAGHLVSPIEYYQGLAAEQKQGSPMHLLFAQKAEEAQQQAKEIREEYDKKGNNEFNPLDKPILHFLYMRDAHFLLSAAFAFPLTSDEGFWWRCRLNTVTGFMWTALITKDATAEVTQF